MRHTNRNLVIAALFFGAINGGQASAQSSGGPYRIEPVVIAGGGGPIAGGNYQITSTLGQPASGVLTGGSYAIFDGFWSPASFVFGDFVFADGYESN
jgi:hypothetical protein